MNVIARGVLSHDPRSEFDHKANACVKEETIWIETLEVNLADSTQL